MNYRYIESPIGYLLLAGNEPRLKVIGFPSGKGMVTPDPDWIEDQNCFPKAKKQLGWNPKFDDQQMVNNAYEHWLKLKNTKE